MIELGSARRESRQQHGFHVLTGTSTLWTGRSAGFRKLPHRLRALVWLSGGQIQWRTIQLVLDAGYADGYRKLHGSDPGYTFPTWSPHVRLDYIFVPAAFVDHLVGCEIINGPAALKASDHFPFLSEVAV